MEINIILGYTGAVLTGLVLGLLGGGGALLSIPVLVYLFHIDATLATAYSLFLVGTTAFSGAFQNLRKKNVNLKIAAVYGVPSLIAVYTMRRFVIPALPDVLLTIGSFSLSKNLLILSVLSVVMFGAGIKMIRDGGKQDAPAEGSVNYFRLAGYAFLVSAFLGLVGAGGGFLMTPALLYFGKLDMKKAVGTSLVLVSVNSYIGFLGDLSSNAVMDWSFLLTFAAFSIGGIVLGTYLTNFIDGSKLKKSFGWFVLAVGVFIIVKELMR